MTNKKVFLISGISSVVTLIVGILLFRLFALLDTQPTSPITQTPPITTPVSLLENTIITTISQAQKSIAQIQITTSSSGFIGQGGGSAIVLTEDGLLLTNSHVLPDPNMQANVVIENTTYSVAHIRQDPMLDLAVIKVLNESGAVPDGLTPAHFPSLEQTINRGQFVVALGYPQGSPKISASLGMLSMLGAQINGSLVGYLLSNTSVTPGQSGGPLVNLAGQTVGIVTASGRESAGLTYSIPLSKELVDSLISMIETSGQIFRPTIGIQYTENSQGVLITQVLPNTPASKAGFQSGDLITRIEQIPLNGSSLFLNILISFGLGQKIDFTITRGSSENHISLDF